MLYYAAPLEGVTGRAWRLAHQRCFPGAARYYAPFIPTNQERRFRIGELRDIEPERNPGVPLIPQLLSRSAEDFIPMAAELFAMGFPEVNLNLGCPSGTVTAKGKGCGLLGEPEALRRFLDAVFSAAPGPISIKTRLGLRSPAEFETLLPIYESYPIAELIVHARSGAEQYRPGVHRDIYEAAAAETRLPLCYNGDLFTPGDIKSLLPGPGSRAVMLGRGLMSDPALIRRAEGGPPASREELRAFHDALLAGLEEELRSFGNALRHMKEQWAWLIRRFRDDGRCARDIARARCAGDYYSAVGRIFDTLPLTDEQEK